MPDIQTTTVEALIAQGGHDLFARHWDEIALHKRLMLLKPDLPRYYALQSAGALLCLSMMERGQLVGYSVNIIGPNLHYADLVVCSNDLLFVAPEQRRGRCGLRLMQATEREAVQRGARLMTWHAKAGSALDCILQAKGYGVQDIIYSREI